MTFKVSTKKKSLSAHSSKDKSFSIDADNYAWSRNSNGTMEVRLGNMTNAGWYWNGNQSDLNGFLWRINRSSVRDEFLQDIQKEGISFAEIKPVLLKSAGKGDGLYEMSGDNAVWKFGNAEETIDYSYEFEEEGLTEEQQQKVWQEYTPIGVDEFEKKHKQSYKKDMVKAVEKSNSYKELWEAQASIAQGLAEDVSAENMDRFYQAMKKVKENK